MQKSILITGCSSGIGKHAAMVLKEKGYRVFATARKQHDVAQLQREGFESTLLDVDDSTSIQQALQFVLEKTGGTLDALFNNAGYAIPGAVEDLTRDMIRQQFESNVFGPVELTNRVIPIMRKQGHGRIILNTSILGVVAVPFRGAYNASKFALEGFSNTLRQELRSTGIFVSIIAPGPIESRFRDNAYQRYQETLRDKTSHHTKSYQRMEDHLTKTTESDKQLTSGPDAVVKQLLHALESKRPKARYYIGFAAHLMAFARRLLPDTGLDWVIRHSMKETDE